MRTDDERDMDTKLEDGWCEESRDEDGCLPRSDLWTCHDCRRIFTGSDIRVKIVDPSNLSWIVVCFGCAEKIPFIPFGPIRRKNV